MPLSSAIDGPFTGGPPTIESIKRWANETPTASAVRLGESSLDYRTLDQASDRLAADLLEAGVSPGEYVALVTDRSPGFIIGLAGIHKAGCGYVPLDPFYPADRLDFAIEDSGCRVAVRSGDFPYQIPLPDHRIVEVDWIGSVGSHGVEPAVADPGSRTARPTTLPDPDPSSVAYLIYTSGSTGKPKGVPINHRNLAFSTLARLEYYREQPGRFFLTSSFSFDSSVAGIYWSLYRGSELCISPAGSEKDPGRLASLLEETRATHVLLLPAMYELVLRQPRASQRLASLECVIVAGEECPASLPRLHNETLGDVPLYNEYGPTEATVWATVHPISAADTSDRVPIGKAIPGAQVHLLDALFQPVREGEAGEIFIGGPGVASGYHERSELTEERFVPDPQAPDSLMYRTGDLARMRADGALEFLGRSDHQVKIRGFRVELGEVESAIRSSTRVRECAAALHRKPSGTPYLVAYLVMADPADRDLTWGSLVTDPLPDAMVPSRLVLLDELPRLPNGKVDREALPEPGNERPELAHPYAPANTPLERDLVDLWEDVLELSGVGIDDPFFELGGSSLAAARAVAGMEEALGESIFVVTLFEAPTIRAFAELLRKQYADSVLAGWPEESVRKGTRDRTLAQADFSGFGAFVPTLEASARQGTPGNESAVFILSPPRSGSTLLRVMLAGHPDLYATDELQLLGFDDMATRREYLSGRFDLWREGLLRTVMDLAAADVAQAQQIVAGLEREKVPTGEVFGRLQGWAGHRLLVDKTTAYAMDPRSLERAVRDFRSPRFIHLVRHPYATIRSFERMHMDQVLYLHRHEYSARELGELVWWQSNEVPRRFLEGLDSGRWCRIRFEDLVADPTSTMRELCLRLDIPFHEGLLNPYENLEQKLVDGVHAESKPMGDVGLLKQTGINPAIAESWKAVANDDFLSETTWTLAERFGYDRPDRQGAEDRRRRRSRLAQRRKKTRGDTSVD